MLTIDHSHLLLPLCVEHGLDAGQLPQLVNQAESAYFTVMESKRQGKLGFMKLPYQVAEVQELIELADQVRSECEALVVIGIGGSDLGARAVHRALNHQFYNLKSTPRLFFFGDTTDPVAVQEVFEVVNLAKTIFVVISKSGNTVEQMSTFTYVRSQLIEHLGEEESVKHIIVLTDKEKGTLREIVKKDGYRSLAVPDDVGGRFSVLSNTALFPLAVVGIDVQGLLNGAMAMDEHNDDASLADNLPLRYAVLQHWAYQQGMPISILMPYTYGLREVGFWFRQLWAESLGKKVNLKGEPIHVGPTPIAAVGPTDQHSQAQLYMEGPYDKIISFLTVKEPAINWELPEAHPDIEGIAYLKGHSFQEILMAEQQSTARALAENGHPSLHIALDKLNAFTVGELLYFFELAVSYAGVLFDVNTYDQPGVELGKQYMYQQLGRAGFEAPKA